MHNVDLFMDFLLPVPPQKCGFDFEVNQIYLDGKSPIMVQALLCNKLQTQLHVFNKCKQALDCYTWRHMTQYYLQNRTFKTKIS